MSSNLKCNLIATQALGWGKEDPLFAHVLDFPEILENWQLSCYICTAVMSFNGHTRTGSPKIFICTSVHFVIEFGRYD